MRKPGSWQAEEMHREVDHPVVGFRKVIAVSAEFRIFPQDAISASSRWKGQQVRTLLCADFPADEVEAGSVCPFVNAGYLAVAQGLLHRVLRAVSITP